MFLGPEVCASRMSLPIDQSGGDISYWRGVFETSSAFKGIDSALSNVRTLFYYCPVLCELCFYVYTFGMYGSGCLDN